MSGSTGGCGVDGPNTDTCSRDDQFHTLQFENSQVSGYWLESSNLADLNGTLIVQDVCSTNSLVLTESVNGSGLEIKVKTQTFA